MSPKANAPLAFINHYAMVTAFNMQCLLSLTAHYIEIKESSSAKNCFVVSAAGIVEIILSQRAPMIVNKLFPPRTLTEFIELVEAAWLPPGVYALRKSSRQTRHRLNPVLFLEKTVSVSCREFSSAEIAHYIKYHLSKSGVHIGNLGGRYERTFTGGRLIHDSRAC